MILTKRLQVSLCTKYDEKYKNKMEADRDIYQYALGNPLKEDETLHKKYEFSARHKDKGFFIGYFKGYVLTSNPQIFWLQILMVDKPYLRKGFGTEIVEGIEDGLKVKGGISEIYLSVLFNNYPAKKFWTKLGYSICKTLDKNVFGDQKETICIYRKTLSQTA